MEYQNKRGISPRSVNMKRILFGVLLLVCAIAAYAGGTAGHSDR